MSKHNQSGGELTPAQRTELEGVGSSIGFSKDEADQIIDETVREDGAANAYQELQIAPGDVNTVKQEVSEDRELEQALEGADDDGMAGADDGMEL